MPGQVVLQFHGAAQTVTGSRYEIEADGAKVLVDCGLFQGLKELRERNWQPLPFAADELDAVLLTHAHLDHCGALPLLVRHGFRGPIYATKWTCELAAVVLRDSARLHEEDAEYAGRKGYSKHAQPLPLYDQREAEAAIRLFQAVDYDVETPIVGAVSATFRPAGHILGAAFLEVTADGKRLLFSGDLGRAQHLLLNPPSPISAGRFDAVITESTYGDREHETSPDEVADVINRTAGRGGSVLIPAFAVDRTEVILLELRRLMDEQRIPRLPIFLDSPMALTALRFYRKALLEGSPELRSDQIALARASDVFDSGTLYEVTEAKDSELLNHPQQPCVIISASGMATGGRVVHHLKGMLPNPHHTVLLAGYQAVGTRGFLLQNGATEVKMYGKYVPVRAEIAVARSFSVHADAGELLAWLGGLSEPPGTCFVVHGESPAADSFCERIRRELNWVSAVPRQGERVLI